ncbi:LysE family transporter [Mesorhizobium sp.]|uniref:LysE family transporter n=1 Tax=Mesorhizobium sp. TaxID=1871066 RepID=UPI00257EE783|nr:LysE family transporter [Mesorhizobium sp.]
MLETGHAVAAGLFPFAISYALLAMLPGANFAVVAQAGLTASRATALSAAAGIALGASSLAMVVATGAAALPPGGIAHQIAASLYGAMLVFVGWNSMRRAPTSRSRFPSFGTSGWGLSRRRQIRPPHCFLHPLR